MTSVVSGLSPGQIAALPTAVVAKLTTSDIKAMSPAQVGGLTAAQLNVLPAADIQSFTNSQLGAISYGTFLAISALQTANFTASQIGGLSYTQILALTPDQLNHLGAADLQALNISYLTKAQFGALSAAQIKNLSPAQIGALSTNKLNVLSPAQIGGLLNTQVNALTAAQLNGLSQTNLNALPAAQIGYLNGTAISGLTTDTLALFLPSQTASLLASKANRLSAAQIFSFSASQLGATTLVGHAGGLQFNFSRDSSLANAPSGYLNAAFAAAAGLAANFSNAAVINIQLGFGEVAGSPISGGNAAESASYMVGTGYAALKAGLQKNAGNSTMQATAYNSLSATNPTSGGKFEISTAEAKALGLIGASNALDGYVGLSAALPFEYNQAAAAGKYDAVGIFQHELTEVMGRTGSVGAAFGPGIYTALDLYRYTSTNNANPSNGTPIRSLTQQAGNTSYFSIDGGKTNLGDYNPSNGGVDYADWNANMGNDPFGYATNGVVQKMSGNDVIEMAAIGWNMTSQGITAAQAAATYAAV